MVEGERKQATVLHCTVANAAGVVERLGSMTMQELMRELMRIADEAVRRYEGMISQRHADGFVAVFGTPIVHEDDGQRSILAALAIQDRFRALASQHRREKDDRLDLQIGIHTGPLVVTRVADAHHVEYTAVGETMRMADLLQQFAEPGAVLLRRRVGRSRHCPGGRWRARVPNDRPGTRAESSAASGARARPHGRPAR